MDRQKEAYPYVDIYRYVCTYVYDTQSSCRRGLPACSELTSDLVVSSVSLQTNKLGSIDALVRLINYSPVSLFKVN